MKKNLYNIACTLLLILAFGGQNLQGQKMSFDVGIGTGIGIPNGQLLARNLLKTGLQTQLTIGAQLKLGDKWGLYLQALPTYGAFKSNNLRSQSDCLGTTCLTFQTVDDSVRGRGLRLFELPILFGATYSLGKGFELSGMLGANFIFDAKSFVFEEDGSEQYSMIMDYAPEEPVVFHKIVPISKLEVTKSFSIGEKLDLLVGASAQFSLARRIIIEGYTNFDSDHSFRPNSYILRLGLRWH